jgi:hypothetical protein
MKETASIHPDRKASLTEENQEGKGKFPVEHRYFANWQRKGRAIRLPDEKRTNKKTA